MPDQATLYLNETDPLDEAELARLGAKAEPRRAGLLMRRLLGYKLRLAEARVLLNVMPAGERNAHLKTFRRFAEEYNAPDSFLHRISGVSSVYGLVIEPEVNKEVLELLERTLKDHDGFLFTPAGQAVGPNGEVLFAAEEAVDEEAPETPNDRPSIGTLRALEAEQRLIEQSRQERAPDPYRVRARAMVLLGISLRGFAENELDSTDKALRKTVDWLERNHFLSEAEPPEDEFLKLSKGSLSAQESMDCSWRCEGVAVLLWALGLEDLPEHDRQVETEPLVNALGFMGKAHAMPELRDYAEIQQAAAVTRAIHWRLREYSRRRRSIDFPEAVARALCESVSEEKLPLCGRDLAIGGVAIDDADGMAVASALGIAQERHQALNWLLGYARRYSEVDTST